MNWLGRVFILLLDPRVPYQKKLLFLFLVIFYWLAPDLMPFVPLDDLLVTLLGGWLFVQSASKDVTGHRPGASSWNSDTQGAIDVEGRFIDED